MASGIQIRDASNNILVDTTTFFFKTIDVTEHSISGATSISLPAAYSALISNAYINVYAMGATVLPATVSVSSGVVNISVAAGTTLNSRLRFELF